METNNLSLKKVNLLSSSRKEVTSSPFIINDLYHVDEKLINEQGLQSPGLDVRGIQFYDRSVSK